ncbi:hypothetical protein [Novosphingobium sp.]|jgi:hypothetical protein
MPRLPRRELAGAIPMQDILWIGLTLALLAASLGYVGLCNKA